jgi:hypothetical protein
MESLKEDEKKKEDLEDERKRKEDEVQKADRPLQSADGRRGRGATRKRKS